jgi:Fe-S-cluster-containing hydrogenase component 2
MSAAFAGVMGFAGLARMIPSRNLARPPGATPEERFLQSCLRCGACTKVCPVGGIGIAQITDGLENVGTPMLALPAGYCMVFKGLQKPSARAGTAWKSGHENEELCSECIQVCPTAALQPTNLNQLHMGTAVVYKEQCLAWRYINCTFPCLDVCVFNAITITTGPVVDAKKCVGCNQCSFVCPARETGPTGIMVEATPPNE